jgi:hypothetical protein
VPPVVVRVQSEPPEGEAVKRIVIPVVGENHMQRNLREPAYRPHGWYEISVAQECDSVGHKHPKKRKPQPREAGGLEVLLPGMICLHDTP